MCFLLHFFFSIFNCPIWCTINFFYLFICNYCQHIQLRKTLYYHNSQLMMNAFVVVVVVVYFYIILCSLSFFSTQLVSYNLLHHKRREEKKHTIFSAHYIITTEYRDYCILRNLFLSFCFRLYAFHFFISFFCKFLLRLDACSKLFYSMLWYWLGIWDARVFQFR